MAESKNNFIKAKMNQDLDDRLVPQGEYRVGQNVTISRSEGDGVGTFQNILGNNQLSDFGLTDQGLEIIGYFVEEVNDRLFIFVTNYNDSSLDQVSNPAPAAASNYIVRYDFNTNSSTILVQGSFLNFSKTHRVYGVNIIENLLFWTDNRNQPRKININLASSNVLYYDSEDKISVAKFYPSVPPQFYKEIKIKTDGSGVNSTSLVLNVRSSAAAEGLFVGMPVGLTSSTGLGLDIYLTTVSSIDGSVTLSSPASWSSNQSVSFSEYGLKNCSDPYLPTIYEGVLTAKNTGVNDGLFLIEQVTLNSSLVNPVLEGVDSLYVNSELHIASSGSNEPVMVVDQGYKIVQYDTSGTAFIKIQTASGSFPVADDIDANGRIKIYRANPDYDINFAGDSEFLKDKFVRFSYRYKFDDNEYSLMAPFTQIAFTPKQFGSVILNNEESAAKSSVLDFFENNIDCIDLYIRTPFESIDISTNAYDSWNFTLKSLNIKEVEVLCKFSNETSVKVIDVLDINFINSLSENGNSDYIKYSYKSTKPIRVLPEKDITRVYDKAPIKALAQEVSGNRIMYGNYIDKHTSPLSLDYKLAIAKKLDIPLSQDKRIFPTHSLKENRTYQVGIVLSDRYGRQSDVILSSIQDAQDVSGALYGSSTIYNNFSDSNSFSAGYGLLDFTGKQLLLYLETAIPQTIPQGGYPGLYSSSNPLGWYTYKIVVQQQEQEYYNVYTPSIYRSDSPNYDFINSYFPLINDNINKVPKDLSNVGPEEKEFRSSVNLFPRVNPTEKTVDADTELTSFFIAPLRKNDEVSSIIYNAVSNINIANGSLSTKGVEVNVDKIYKGKSATIANVVNNKLIGTKDTDTTDDSFGNLGVYETNPFVSNLDIYYESSTSGFISELNNSIETGTIGPVSITKDNLELYENTEPYFKGSGTDSQPERGTVVYTIELKDSNGIAILSSSNTCSISSVTSSFTGNVDRSALFTLVPQVSGTPALETGRFNIYANEYVYFESGQNWNFNISATANGITNNTLSFSGAMSNIQPQYNQQGNINDSQLGNSFIPVSIEPYKNYTRETSTGLSLKPNDYTGLNQGDNNAKQGLSAIQNVTQASGFIGGSMPFLYFLKSDAIIINPPLGSSFNIPNSYYVNDAYTNFMSTGVVPYNKNSNWELRANNIRAGSPSLPSVYNTNSYSPYWYSGGLNDWLIQKNPNPGPNPPIPYPVDGVGNPPGTNKYSAVFWWRNLLYGNGTTTSFSNYPTEFRGGSAIGNTTSPSSNLPLKTRLLTPGIQMYEESKFYSLIGYNSISGEPGPWNVIEQNQNLSIFATANGDTGFLNGTLDTNKWSLDLSYSITDLHFPTGDILADPFNPTGRFTDTTGEIATLLGSCVSIDNSGKIKIIDNYIHDLFGINGTKINLIPDSTGWSNCGIILNDRLGHGKLFRIETTENDSSTGQPVSYVANTGSYGMFWIGFTLNVSDAGNATTEVPINLLIIS